MTGWLGVQCNILSEDGVAMEGPEFRRMTRAEQLRAVVDLQVTPPCDSKQGQTVT